MLSWWRTGGLSFAKLGASDPGHRIAHSFGIGVTELCPGLVPLTFQPKEKGFFESLAGVSLPVRVTHSGASFEEALLFTHRGVSGPAILQISSYWREGEPVRFDLLPSRQESESFASSLRGGATPIQILSRVWPRRFAEAWCTRHAPDKPLARCSKSETEEMTRSLHAWETHFSGTEGYPKAEVTLGGVDTGRTLLQDHGIAQSSGTLLHRRGGGRDGLARRI